MSEHFPECNDRCDPATGSHYLLAAPLSKDEEAKLRESVDALADDGYSLHWSNNVATRLLATIDALRSAPVAGGLDVALEAVSRIIDWTKPEPLMNGERYRTTGIGTTQRIHEAAERAAAALTTNRYQRSIEEMQADDEPLRAALAASQPVAEHIHPGDFHPDCALCAASQPVAEEGAHTFCGRCGHPMHWRECGALDFQTAVCPCRNDVAPGLPHSIEDERNKS